MSIGSLTWDHQWNYSSLINNGLCIVPNVNLVSNIGFGKNAIHCKNNDNKFANMPTHEIKEITHPLFVIPDKKADIYTMENYYGLGIYGRVKRELKRIIGKH